MAHPKRATVEFEMSNTPKAIGVIFEENNP